MAGALQCDNHPELEAAFILGHVQTGDQSFFCPLCMGTVGLVMALEVMHPADVIAAGKEKLGKAGKNGHEVAGDKPGRKRRSKASAAHTVARAAGEGMAETPSPADDGRNSGLQPGEDGA